MGEAIITRRGGGSSKFEHAWAKFNVVTTKEFSPRQLEQPLPFESTYSSAINYNGELHLLGSDRSSAQTAHYKWDGTHWLIASNLPFVGAGSCVVEYNGELHILGSQSTNYTKHYKWNGYAWESVSTLPYSFGGYVNAVVYNNKIHIFGSYTTTPYTQHYSWDGSTWESVSTIPSACRFPVALIYKNKVHLIAPNNDAKHYVYNDDGTWTTLNDLPVNRNYTPAFVYDEKLYYIGRNTTIAPNYECLYVYDDTSDTFELVEKGVPECRNSCSCVYNNNVYVMGGHTSDGNLLVMRSLFNDTETLEFMNYVSAKQADKYPQEGKSTDGYYYSYSIPTIDGKPFEQPTNFGSVDFVSTLHGIPFNGLSYGTYVQIGEKIYAKSGQSSRYNNGEVGFYDLETGIYTKALLDENAGYTNHTSYFVKDGKVYFKRVSKNICDTVDIATDEISTEALPTDLSNEFEYTNNLVTVGNDYYSIGSNQTTYWRRVYKYDTSREKWIKSDVSTPLAGYPLRTINYKGLTYTLGWYELSYSSNAISAKCYKFDGNSFTLFTSMPYTPASETEYYINILGLKKENLYIGIYNANYYSVWILNLETAVWTYVGDRLPTEMLTTTTFSTFIGTWRYVEKSNRLLTQDKEYFEKGYFLKEG